MISKSQQNRIELVTRPDPLQCYQKDKWSEFSKFSTEVLRTFKSSKIDSVAAGTGSGGRKKLKSVGGSGMRSIL